jgi:knotted carbamoyltransferase YgeW
MKTLQDYIDKLNSLNFKEMYENDFFLTWEKTDDELEAVWTVADALRFMRENNISTKVFESGLGISLFRDNSTRTRFSFASACNLLGLEVQDLDEGKSQVAHGETVRETANMISFMADVIGIRDDMYIGKGNAYMHEVAEAVTRGHQDGILEQKPTLVNLQCDIDHPTQSMADMLHIIHEFGGLQNLKGKKLAMTWAYSPSYGKPLCRRFLRSQRRMRKNPEVPSVFPMIWRMLSKMRISYIQRAGHRLQPWKREQIFTEKGIWTGSRHWRRTCWPRMHSIRIGAVPKN